MEEELAETEQRIAHAKAMKTWLEEGLRCNYLRIEDCEMVLARVP